MQRRYVSIWFPHLITDWFSNRQPYLRDIPFVICASSHGRMMITAANQAVIKTGITRGMVLADARAILPSLEVLDDKPGLPDKLLLRLAEWCIRFTPGAAADPPDGLLLDVAGCPHLWGGDHRYVEEIGRKLRERGYSVRIAIADTIGAAWAVARFGNSSPVVETAQHVEALLDLPPEALRLEEPTVERLHKLGLDRISKFIHIPRATLRRRFGNHFLMRLDTACGHETEVLHFVQPIVPYYERLPCLEPIATATGIAIALDRLLNALCARLQQDQKGLRTAVFSGYRSDGKVEKLQIETNSPSYSVKHLFRLFETKLPSIEPALGIELFVLEAPKVEDHFPVQEKLWETSGNLDDIRLAELIDRLSVKLGPQTIHRYLPDEHYWPERSYKPAGSLQELTTATWKDDGQRPLQLLPVPERIEVTAPIPDYPPMLFRFQDKVHKVIRADGPERIEQEWWLQQGQHRDYYRVEDEAGNRYWLFRSGHYSDKAHQWFIHGFFP